MSFRLKELRKKKHLSQIKLAIDLNMNQNTISRYENEIREADYKTLILFADYFDVSIDYLLGRTDIPNILRWKKIMGKVQFNNSILYFNK